MSEEARGFAPLDTRMLQTLCEAVVRDVSGYHDSEIPKAQDDAWARLEEESLPALEAFIASIAQS